jgi:anti-anti-sigma factor
MREEIRSKLVGGAAVIYPGPYLNQLKGEDIERLCRQFLAQGVRRLIINFQQTELINSIGISILLGIVEAVSASSGRLMLSNLNSTNKELFEALGLLSYLEIADTEEEALARLSAASAAGF